MSLGVSVYCLLRRTPLPPGVRLSAHDNRPVTARRNWYKVTKPGGGFDPQTDLLQSHDIMRGIKMGSRYLCFESDELNRAMKELAPVGLYLLGFKPLKELKRHYHIRPPQFVYPNESVVRGSRTWFSLLLHVCLRRDLFALAVYVPRKRTPPRLVALTPQAERLDADGTQLYPPGFLLVFLPYADDFRNLDLPSASLASADQVEAAKSLIKKLTVPFDPRQIHNPLLQRHYAMLEALALNKDELPTEVIDETLPNITGINRRAGAELENFKRACHLEDASFVKWPPREFEPGASGQSTPELTTEHIRGLVERDELHTLTVPTLRQALKILKSTPLGRKKVDLVSQITNHFR
ncbi:unnamed protein product [Dicrocoelium dendriticum]|nr:unnamed protein product [Dicrocoelium dendriticum]